jgi:hypothetical protein
MTLISLNFIIFFKQNRYVKFQITGKAFSVAVSALFVPPGSAGSEHCEGNGE